MTIPFNPGTGGDLKSTTLEHAVLELWTIAMNAESTLLSGNPQYTRQFSVQVAVAGGTGTSVLTGRILTKAVAQPSGELSIELGP